MKLKNILNHIIDFDNIKYVFFNKKREEFIWLFGERVIV